MATSESKSPAAGPTWVTRFGAPVPLSRGPGTSRLVSTEDGDLWKFAMLPQAFWKKLAERAAPEGRDGCSWPIRSLQQYLYYTFIRLLEQNRLVFDQASDPPEWVCFNSGLNTRLQEPIVIFLQRYARGSGDHTRMTPSTESDDELAFLSEGALSVARSSDRMLGKVVKWDKAGGFGKVVVLETNTDVGLHHSQLKVKPGVFRSVSKGDMVEFSLLYSDSYRQWEAVEVTAVGGGLLQGEQLPQFVGNESSVTTLAKVLSYQLGITAANLRRATYYEPREPQLLLDWRLAVTVSAEHIVEENYERFVHAGLVDGPMDAAKLATLATQLKGAVVRSRALAEEDYAIAVPQYFYTVCTAYRKEDTAYLHPYQVWQGRLQLLLPLYFTDSPVPQLVLAVSYAEGQDGACEYQASAVLSLWMAWTNARLLSRPHVPWIEAALAPAMPADKPVNTVTSVSSVPSMSSMGLTGLPSAPRAQPPLSPVGAHPISSMPTADASGQAPWQWAALPMEAEPFERSTSATGVSNTDTSTATADEFGSLDNGTYPHFSIGASPHLFPSAPSSAVSVDASGRGQSATSMAPRRRTPPPAESPHESVMTGTIYRWFEPKGYGFISRDGDSHSVFCHITNLMVANWVPTPGTTVQFKLKPNPRDVGHFMAVDVRPTAGYVAAAATQPPPLPMPMPMPMQPMPAMPGMSSLPAIPMPHRTPTGAAGPSAGYFGLM